MQRKTIGNTFTVATLDDPVSFIAQYSPTSTPTSSSQIHTTFQSGDKYMRTRTSEETFSGNVDPNHPWNRIVGENGSETDYSFGISQYTETASPTTAPSDIPSSSWSDSPIATTSSKPYLWAKVEKKDGTGSTTSTTYIRLTGEEGVDASVYIIESTVGSLTIGADETTTSINTTLSFYKKTGESNRETYQCYCTIFKKKGSSYTALRQYSTKSSGVTYSNSNLTATDYDAIVVCIYDAASTSHAGYLAELEIPVRKQGDSGTGASYISAKGGCMQSGSAEATIMEISIFNGHTTETITTENVVADDVTGFVRGLALVVINKNTLTVTTKQMYDTYTDGRATALATALSSITSDYIVCLASHDACGFNSALVTALKGFGSKGVEVLEAGRYPFAFIGQRGLDRGYAFQAQKGLESTERAEVMAYIEDGVLQTVKDPDSAVTYKLLVNPTTVNVGRSGSSFSPRYNSIICGYTKSQGEKITTVNDLVGNIDDTYRIFFSRHYRTMDRWTSYYNYGESASRMYIVVTSGSSTSGFDATTYDKVRIVIYKNTSTTAISVSDFDESLVVDSIVVPVVSEGQQGKTGPNYYFAAEFNRLDNTQTFTATDKEVPYFIYDNQKWMYVGDNFTDKSMQWLYTNKGGYPSSSNANYEIMVTDFKYLISQAVFTAFAKLGSWVFNQDFMFSQFGADGTSNYQQFDPQNPDTWIPNALFNAFDGSGHLAGGKFRWGNNGDVEVEGTIKARNLYHHVVYVGYEDTYYCFDDQDDPECPYTVGSYYSEDEIDDDWGTTGLIKCTGEADIIVVQHGLNDTGSEMVILPRASDYDSKMVEIIDTRYTQPSDPFYVGMLRIKQADGGNKMRSTFGDRGTDTLTLNGNQDHEGKSYRFISYQGYWVKMKTI